MAVAPVTPWRNWSGTVEVSPSRTVHPRTAEEVAAEVRRAAEDDLSVKAIGSGHSFTDIGATRGVFVVCDRLTGILAADLGTRRVTVAAGTTLAELNPALWELGLALPNLGDIDAQTVSGAVSTGTHGTGTAFASIASAVSGLQLVTGSGELVDITTKDDPDLLAAIRTGLGATGIITAVTLDCVPAFALRAVEAVEDYASVLERMGGELRDRDHFEFYWFPYTRRVHTKTNTRLAGDVPLQPIGRAADWLASELVANRVFEQTSRLTTARPGLTRTANRIAARAMGRREYIDRSYNVFCSPRRVVFREMEYAVPQAAAGHVLHELDRWLRRSDEQISFPLEVRFGAAEDIPLSMSYGRDTCYIAAHVYHRRPYEKYFEAFEAIARDVDGRPHWGKLHFRSHTDLAGSYPEFETFAAARDRLDPDRRFGNDYLRRVLGS